MEEFKAARVKVVLPVKLDHVELGRFARRSHQTRKDKFDEIMGLRKLAKIRKRELEEEEQRASKVIMSGVEEREVTCDKIINFPQNRVKFLDPNTKKVIHERELNEEEKQMDMFEGFKDPVKEKAFKRKCNKCSELYIGTKRICFNCQKLDEYKYAPEGA
jgi:hypothetical protein